MTLEDYRSELDVIDKTLEDYFVRRMQIVAKIGDYKKEHGIPTLDSSREAKVLEKHTAGHPDIIKPYMEEYFKTMMALSRRYQDELKEKD